MADYTLSARGTYDGSSFNRGVAQSGNQLDTFKGKCTAISVAIGNLMSAAVQKVGSAISGSLDSAISRVDTMNNFSKVMSNMGISADDANEAIRTLSGDALKGLPTTLDSAVAGVQRLTSKNQDVKKSTDYFLAMNNAIVAGGTDMGIQQSALEQLAQAYSKGQMDMNEWRAVQQAMPAQLNQVAKAMGMTTDEMGEGLRKGTISMDSFMDTLVQLNKEGIDGFASLEEQARSATGGIATQMTNMNTAVTRSLANVIDRFNSTGAISKSISLITSGIDNLGKAAAPVAEAVGKRLAASIDTFTDSLARTGDPIKSFGDAIKTAFVGTPIETFANMVGDFVKSVSGDLKVVIGIVKNVASAIGSFLSSMVEAASGATPFLTMVAKAIPLFLLLKSGITALTTAIPAMINAFKLSAAAISPVTVAITAAAAILAVLAVAFVDAQAKEEAYDKATHGLNDAVKSLGDTTGNTAKSFGEVDSALSTSEGNLADYTLSVDELIEKNGELADSISRKFSDVNAENAALQAYADKIAELAGNCDGSADKVSELKAAVDGYNEIAGTSYQVTDDFSGALDVSTEKLLENAQAFQARAKAAAAQEVLIDLYKEQYEAEKTLTQTETEYNDALAAKQEYLDRIANGGLPKYEGELENLQNEVDRTKKAHDEAQGVYETNERAINDLSEDIVEYNREAQNLAKSGIRDTISANEELCSALEETGSSVDEASEKLGDLGMTTDDVTKLTGDQMKGLAGVWDSSINEIADACDQLGVDMPSYLKGAMTAASEVTNKGGSEAAANWIRGMSAQEYAIVENAAKLSGKSTAEFVAQLEPMCAAGKDDVVAFAQGVLDGKPISDDAASTTGQSATDQLEASSDGTPAAEKLGETFSDGQNTNAGDASAAQMAQNANATLEADADGAPAASGFSNSFGGNIDTSAGDYNASQMAQNAVDSAESVDASGVGSALSSGAAAGIDVWAMVSNAVQMVRNAITAANNEAQTASPSKVMKRFGRNFAKGAAVGVKEDAALMTQNTVSMVRGAISSVERMPSPSLGTLGFTGASVSARSSFGVRRRGSGGGLGGYDTDVLLVSLYDEVADLNSSLGRKIAENAPVVVESERQAARRIRRAQHA